MTKPGAADDQAVERVAKVLADDAGWDWHEDSYVSPDPKWQPTDKAEYRRMARKALAAAAGVPVDAAEHDAAERKYEPDSGKAWERGNPDEVWHRVDPTPEEIERSRPAPGLDTERERLRERVADTFCGDKRGTGHAAYRIANLRAALAIAPDTGDWHGELRILLNEVERAFFIDPQRPNVSVESQEDQLRRHLAKPGENTDG